MLVQRRITGVRRSCKNLSSYQAGLGKDIQVSQGRGPEQPDASHAEGRGRPGTNFDPIASGNRVTLHLL